MIRRVGRCRIPGKALSIAKGRSARFAQDQMDECFSELAKKIPHPAFRQIHSVVTLSDGGVEMHTDNVYGFLPTAYCLAIHVPRGAKLWQNHQWVDLKVGQIYSFNQLDYHGVSVPDGSRTFSAFIVVDILDAKSTKRLEYDMKNAEKKGI